MRVTDEIIKALEKTIKTKTTTIYHHKVWPSLESVPRSTCKLNPDGEYVVRLYDTIVLKVRLNTEGMVIDYSLYNIWDSLTTRDVLNTLITWLEQRGVHDFKGMRFCFVNYSVELALDSVPLLGAPNWVNMGEDILTPAIERLDNVLTTSKTRWKYYRQPKKVLVAFLNKHKHLLTTQV